MRKKIGKSGTYVTECFRKPFLLDPGSFGPPSRALGLSPGEGWDAVT